MVHDSVQCMLGQRRKIDYPKTGEIFSNVSPWHLCTVRVKQFCKGNCLREAFMPLMVKYDVFGETIVCIRDPVLRKVT